MSTKSIKNLIIFIVIVALLGGAYFFFFKDQVDEQVSGLISSSGRSPLDPAVEVDTTDVTDLIVLLTSLRQIALDNSLFESATFQNLRDISVEITLEPPQNTGRFNPFAPIGSDFVAPSQQQSVQEPVINFSTPDEFSL